ncbi:MAG: ABC-F family ATP-binding cassette domain-containing protein [Deltaproteobacteria bacterium]|nr:ABC-F family ATP-binding cassette domain-containing protein [Deltaproteobacteria bacterium]
MGLITAINLSITFLGKPLFHELGFQVDPGQRIGLVGPNGSGKTTLLRLIVGEVLPDDGEMRVAKGARIGYLPQDIYETLSGTLLQSVRDSIPERVEMCKEKEEAERALNGHPDREGQARAAARLAEIHQTMADLDARFPSHRGERILEGLGFAADEFDRPLSSLSGGWKMRAALAGLLYQDPDILLMDEPTNHLDIPSVRWLEEFLLGYRGAMILICHDKDFLNRQVSRTFAFEPEGFRIVRGNYDRYLEAREEEKRGLEAKARNQGRKVKEAQKFIERFRSKSSKARQAQSKIKLLDKIALVETHKNEKTIRFSFPPVSRSGRNVLSLQCLSKGFGDKTLYRGLNLRVMRGERVAIIGPNGAGKTTLLRMVAGELEPDEGEILLGHEVAMSYYAQHHSEMLDARSTILDEVYRMVPHQTVSFVRGVCGAFLFPGDDVEKAVGILSGGEKARVSLARILVNPGNFIVMDEPTNHLDLISSEVLIEALSAFTGTLLFVSHNQSFVNRLATKIWDIREGGLVEYPGNLYEYLDHMERRETREPPSGPQKEASLREEPGQDAVEDRANRKAQRRERAERRERIRAVLKPIQEKIRELEERIEALERTKTEQEKTLADPDLFKDKGKSLPLLNEYGGTRKKLEELMARWEYQQEKLATAQRELDLVEGEEQTEEQR